MAAGLGAGDLLDNRYRLDRLCHTSGERELWHATDQVLERGVAVHLLATRSRADAKAIAAAAGRAGGVPDARWVRVLDVGSVPAGRKVTVWIVCEWVEGTTLTTLLRREPMRDQLATFLVASCAQAVAAAQAAGARHGRLHPDEVLIPSDGYPRLTGLEIHQAQAGEEESYDDVRGLGALLFAAVTGHWPLRGWRGLPEVQRGDGLHPRTQRRSVGRALDDVTALALSGGYSDAAHFARALARLPQTPLVAASEDADSENRERLRRIAWWVVPPVLVAAVGVASWTAGSRLGRVPGADRVAASSFAQPRSQSTSGVNLVWSKPPTATSFDPQGNGIEDPGGVGLAVDDDPSTTWNTDVYRGSPRFGGLKNGVGLLLDLGRPKKVDTARLLLSAPGADIELRAGPTSPSTPDELPIVANRSDSPASVTLRLDRSVRARYWLIWITSLPRTGDNTYSLGIAELALLH
ncbi:MAG TPA: hypothetical protein VHD81_01940 [Mycobacteriales bacterium]|nr:hypothetical protein [Mycobacteriales bacterium]